jgi:hypothetical protein
MRRGEQKILGNERGFYLEKNDKMRGKRNTIIAQRPQKINCNENQRKHHYNPTKKMRL